MDVTISGKTYYSIEDKSYAELKIIYELASLEIEVVKAKEHKQGETIDLFGER